MALNMKTLTQALAKTAAVIEKTVHTTVQEVTGPKPLQDYDLLDQIGSAGPGLAWKLYSAKARDSHNLSQQYPTVCVWVLDKRALSEARTRAGLSKAAEDSFLDIIRADAARLVRLRHPGVVHVVQSLDETKNAMAMVTEPLFASVANVLGNVENVEKVPKVLKGMEMGLLEMKHGLLQIAETLDFLHNNARLIHRAICPETVLITSNGAWKLSGFGFTISADQSADSAGLHGFHYTEYDDDDSVLPLQPSLNYTAPELVRSKASSVGCSSDIFSFGCLAYHLIARKPLFDCHNNVKMYMNNLTYLSSGTFSSIPPELVPELQKMLSANESIRPQALDFTASSFFRDDTRLRALRFLDHMLERDNMQKSEFLKALTDMWKDFDSRVLRYKVLPPLCAELRNMVMQPMILPMVLTIAESQDRIDFELSTLPALVPVLSTAAGETLLLLVRHCDLIITKASHDHLVSHVLPMLVRAYDDNDARLQEEVLKKTTSLAKQLDVQLVKKTILPRVHGLALKTTVAAVRVNALFCLSDMVHMLDKHAVLDILQTIQRCTAVDRSAPTLMCTLGVANSILKQCGIEFTSEHVLPLLTPLLVAQQLNVQQFAKYMLFVKGVLRQIEEKRGVTLNSYGVPEVRSSAAAAGVADGHLTEAVKKITATPPSTTRSTPAWDEDWIPKSTTQISSTKNLSSIQSSAVAIEPIQVSTANPVSSLLSGQQASSLPSCPAVDLEWPPRSSFDGTSTVSAKQDSSIDIDPFADWPPRHSGSSSSTPGSFNNGTTTVMPTTYNSAVNAYNLNGMSTTQASSWSFPQNFGEPLGQNQGMNSSGQNSLGFLKQNHGNSVLGSSSEKAMDLGSIFGSSKSEQMAPRLAPPPSTAVGRGRGRGRGRGQGQVQGRSSHVKSSSEQQQPSLLDLL